MHLLGCQTEHVYSLPNSAESSFNSVLPLMSQDPVQCVYSCWQQSILLARYYPFIGWYWIGQNRLLLNQGGQNLRKGDIFYKAIGTFTTLTILAAGWYTCSSSSRDSTKSIQLISNAINFGKGSWISHIKAWQNPLQSSRQEGLIISKCHWRLAPYKKIMSSIASVVITLVGVRDAKARSGCKHHTLSIMWYS